LIVNHDFGYLAASNPESAVLEGSYISAYSGFHMLETQDYRPNAPSTFDLPNYIDKITLAPENPASFYWKPEGSYLGVTLYFAYVVLSPGMSLPVLAASNPVNVTAVLMK
jgi:hypothetical protein